MQLVQFFIFSFFISFIIPFSHLIFGLPSGRVNFGFHLYTLFTILSSGIRRKWPNQLNLWAFMWFIIFLCFINSSNLSLVLIFYIPSLSFVGPKFRLNTFISNTINLFFMVSFKTHILLAYVTIGLIYVHFLFLLNLFDITLKTFLLATLGLHLLRYIKICQSCKGFFFRNVGF
jgi:hypothetical protein